MDEANLCTLPTVDITTSLSKDRLKLFLSATPKTEVIKHALLVLPNGTESSLGEFLKTKLQTEEVKVVNTLLKASQAYVEKDFELCVVDGSFESEDLEAFMVDCSNAKKLFASAYLVRSEEETPNLPKGFTHFVREDDEEKNLQNILDALAERSKVHELRMLQLENESGVSSAEVKFRLLISQLTKSVPKELLHLKVIKDIAIELDAGKSIKERRISKGEEPVKGKDGKLLLLVKSFTGEAAFYANEQDTIDYKQLHLFDNIRPDQIVGRLYPPAKGEDGVDALGQTIPAELGNEAALELSDALTLTQEAGKSYQSILSKKYGFLLEIGSKLDVSEEFIVRGDLDLHYGHIDFVGKVVVQGNVLPGFSIKARAGIEISGEVEQASLFCSEGTIEIKGYVHGGQGSKIVSGGSVNIDIAHDLTVEAMQDITINKEAVDCTLRAYRNILMSNSTLIGGTCYFTTASEFHTAGSDLGTKTILNLCNDVEVRSDYSALLSSINEHVRVLELIDLHLGPYAVNSDRIKLLNEKLRAKMEQLLTKKTNVLSSLEKLNAKQQDLLANATFSAPIRVNIVSYAYEGLSLIAGESLYEFREMADGPFTIDFDRESGEFQKQEFKPLDELDSSNQVDTEEDENGRKENSDG